MEQTNNYSIDFEQAREDDLRESNLRFLKAGEKADEDGNEYLSAYCDYVIALQNSLNRTLSEEELRLAKDYIELSMDICYGN